MDGFKKKLNQSIQYRISSWLILIITVMALLAVGISYFTALHEAGEIQDETLEQIALLVTKNDVTLSKANVSINDDRNKESAIIIQLMNPQQTTSLPAIPTEKISIPANLSNGFHNVLTQVGSYRVLIVDTLSNQQKMAIAQPTVLRDEAAKNSAISTILPMLLLIPMVLIAIYLIVQQSIKPISDLANTISQQKLDMLTPISIEFIPIEISPFVEAIHHLLARVSHALEVQRRFVADAAHELRSPLTALSLQAERLASMKMSVAAHENLKILQQGIERNRHLLTQLLTLARAQTTADQQEEYISIHQIFAKVLEDLMPLAEAKNIDIGVKQQADVSLKTNETNLMIIIKNLVDNAIKFTPNQGRIDLSVIEQENTVVIEIEDSGCGIADNEKTRVFEAFYRVLGNNTHGSGLGLSIVKTLLAHIDGTVSMTHSENSPNGLKVTVFLKKSL